MKRHSKTAAIAHRILGLALCVVMALSLVPTAQAAVITPVPSTNINAQEYLMGRRWANTVSSYLYVNPSGGLTRVEYTGGKVVVEDYDSQFRARVSRTFALELPLWGGFFAGEDYNFLVFGQNNEEENDGKEVIRIVKYSKDWRRLDSASLYGANTIHPFDAGSLRCDEYNGYLYVRTCHEMYTSSDGLNHQASVMVLVRESDMKITDAAYEVGGPGYVSHSFNQFVLIDQSHHIITLDHGDAYPRSIVLHKFNAKAGQDSFREEKRVPAEQPGWYYIVYEEEVNVKALPTAQEHYNDTGAALGGLAETSNGYAAAYNYDGAASSLGADNRDVYLSFTNKDLSETKTAKLSSGMDTSVPVLAPTGLDGGYVMWNERSASSWYTASFGKTLYYARYDANGSVGPVKTAAADAPLSDCAPVYWNGKLVWYVTNDSVPMFYTLDEKGVMPYQAAAGAAPANTAYANTQIVLLDGRPVEFQTYALKDSSGDLTNYIKLRDLAYYLNGTNAQFSVGWSAGQGISLTRGAPYSPNGSELSTPFSGNWIYQNGTGKTRIDSASYDIPSIVLTDDNGGEYTYYKLRDMGLYLGFNVSYINNQVVVNTDEPYSADQ